MKTYNRCLVLAFLLAATLFSFAQQQPTPPNPYAATLDRLNEITAIPLSGWTQVPGDMAHGEVPPNTAMTMNASALNLGGDFIPPVWLYREVEIPKELRGYEVRGSTLKLDINVGGNEGLMITTFANGNMIARTDEDGQVPITLTNNAQPGDKIVIALRVLPSASVGCCGGPPQAKLEHAQLLITPPVNRPDPAVLRLELLSAQLLVAAYPDGKAEREQTLDAAVKAIDLKALDDGDQKTFDASLRASQAKLDALRPYMKQFSISAIGNSHIDMAWLWPWTETVEVVRNTFGTALDLMNEYPDFKFTASTAQAYTWIEEKYPEMFKQIQQRVKEGRWEVIGGMWVEPDLNMPDGESLVRQILYGKNYFKAKFGVDVKIGWNPDSFGYNWQLPQIYRRSGIDYFVTQKLLWAHEFTTFPYRLFYWQSPDGSKMLTYFPSDYANQIDPLKMARDSSVYGPAMYKYNGGTDSAPADGLRMMYLYGVGDHGGGPTRVDLDTALRWQKADVVYPKLQFSTATDFFADLKQHQSELKLPTWDGELYFQYHRGVQTTQSETKKGNRKNEVLILNAEKLATIDSLSGAAYPQSGFNTAWEKILFNQFHDILPGSGIGINYVDAARKYAETSRFSNDTIRAALNDIASHVKSDGVSVLVFNPLSWARTEEVEVEAQMPEAFKSIEPKNEKGESVRALIVDDDTSNNRIRLRLLVPDVPAMGYTVVTLSPTATEGVDNPSPLVATATSMENEFLRLTVDPATGCIISLFDKRSKSEALAPAVQSVGAPPTLSDGKPCGNLLQAFVDKPKRWDAWNVDADFIEHHTDLLQAEEVKLIENSPLRAVIRVRHKWQNSEFTQDITMYPGVPRVDVHMQADWHERHILLKVAFPLNVRSDKATFEIPYGTVERPTTRNTPAEKSQFEVPALRWGDISDATHGFSLLNDSKYGYDAKDNVLRLSLLRAPEWPDPNADQGHHEFTYSLYPHAGTWREAMTIRQGYDLNYPLLAVTTTQHPGTLPAQHSFFGTKEDNVVITAVKQAADGSGTIVRFYEWAGKKGDVHLTLPQAATAAWQTNLMEHPEGSLAVAGGSEVTVPTGAYEIKTVKVSFK
ncbi:MAG: glycoside hydrolase family 38 C-terminal domain-containing protein [Candidatus Korobacteraceae bacterium]